MIVLLILYLIVVVQVTNSMNVNVKTQRLAMKQKIFAQSASVNRGFAATNEDKNYIASLIASLCGIKDDSNEENVIDYTKGLLGGNDGDCLLEGTWKMCYTTAFDVLSIDINPLAKVEAIYQDLSANGDSINVIDIGPIFSPLTSDFKSITRLQVRTKAKARSNTRVGLNFVGVNIRSKSLFGIDTGFLPTLGGDFPTTFDEETTPGFFDVLYLDEDCLIIRQNEPGGLFISLREEKRIV